MKRALQYANYIMIHKWYVFVECCKLGIPIRGLLHDMSKFLPSEWKPYSLRFHEKHTLKKCPSSEFKVGFLKHMRRNPHHWQYWIRDIRGKSIFKYIDEETINVLDCEVDSGYTKALCKEIFNGIVFPAPMPEKYCKEMLADWRGASKALNGLDVKSWYLKNKCNMILHSETRAWIEKQLEV